MNLYFTDELYFLIRVFCSFLSSLCSAPVCLSFPSSLKTANDCSDLLCLVRFWFEVTPWSFYFHTNKSIQIEHFVFLSPNGTQTCLAGVIAVGIQTICATFSILLSHLPTDHIWLGMMHSRWTRIGSLDWIGAKGESGNKILNLGLWYLNSFRRPPQNRKDFIIMIAKEKSGVLKWEMHFLLMIFHLLKTASGHFSLFSSYRNSIIPYVNCNLGSNQNRRGAVFGGSWHFGICLSYRFGAAATKNY